MLLLLKVFLSFWVLPFFAISFAGLMGGAIKIYERRRWADGDRRVIVSLLMLFLLSSALWVWIWS